MYKHYLSTKSFFIFDNKLIIFIIIDIYNMIMHTCASKTPICYAYTLIFYKLSIMSYFDMVLFSFEKMIF